MSKNERRKGVRQNRRFAFRFKTMGADNDNTTLRGGMLLDYSMAGIRFLTGEQLPKNTSLLIELDFDNFGAQTSSWRNLWEEKEAESLKVIGSVMWCQENKEKAGEFEVGTRFVEKAQQR